MSVFSGSEAAKHVVTIGKQILDISGDGLDGKANSIALAIAILGYVSRKVGFNLPAFDVNADLADFPSAESVEKVAEEFKVN
jgi:hypothetical protein